MGTCVPNQKPHMGVGISSTKYDKTSLLNHTVVYFTDTNSFLHLFLGMFLTVLMGLLSNAYAHNCVKI